MPKIVIDNRISGTSTGRYSDKLVEYLHKMQPEHDITVLTRTKQLEYIKRIAPNFKVIASDYPDFSFGEQLGLNRQIKQLQPDIVHFPMVQQPVLYGGKTVTTMQDLTTLRFKNPSKNSAVFWVKQQVYKWVNKRAAKRSAQIITPTQFVKDDVVAYTRVSPDKITVTYEAADFISDEPVPFAPVAGKPFIMYIGRPTPHKNLDRLLEAFVELQKSHPDLYLVLAGKADANYQRYATTIAAQQIPHIIFTDFISDAQLRWLLEHCSAYVFPSLSEGFGLPAIEAMGHGAPVVSSNATCLPEVYGDAAHYFDPLDVQDMTMRIGEVLDDPELRTALIKKGEVQAAKYSWQRMAEQTLDVYNKALAK